MSVEVNKPVLLIAESNEFSDNAIANLESKFEVRLRDFDRDQLKVNLEDVDVLWVRLRNMIDKSVMDAAPRLRMIATNTTGLNHIDLEEAVKRRIEIVSLKGESEFLADIRATAEHTIGLTLALIRNLPAAHQHVCDGGWDRYAFKGHELYQRTAGIIGYGRLGRVVARYFKAFGMQVLVSDPNQNQIEPGIRKVELAELLQESDVVSLHVDYRRQNHFMINADVFGQLKDGAVLINTARGELINEVDLLTALKSGQLAGAALDVIDSEHHETPTRSSLIRYANENGNMILTPHIGGNTFESHDKTENFLAEKILFISKAQSV